MKDYLDNYSQIAKDDVAQSILPMWLREFQAKKVVNICKKYRGQKVLDIGMGHGVVLKMLNHKFKVGVDIAKEFCPDIVAVAEHLPLKDKSFDIIIMSDILEHVIEPLIVLNEAKRTLADEGIIVIRTPFNEDIFKYKDSKYKYVHLRTHNKESFEWYEKVLALKICEVHYDEFLVCSMNRLGRTIQRVYDYIRVKYIQRLPASYSLDSHFCELPERIGRLFFVPIEMVVVMRKAI